MDIVVTFSGLSSRSPSTGSAAGAASSSARIEVVAGTGVVIIGEFPPNAIAAAGNAWTLGSRAAHVLALMGGVYLVVRGLDNIDHGLPERWRPAWRRVFGVTQAIAVSAGLSAPTSRRNIRRQWRSDAGRDGGAREASRRAWRGWRIVTADPALLRRGRYLNAICQLDIGGDTFLLRIVDGRIAEVRRGRSSRRRRLSRSRARPACGAGFWRPIRRPATTTCSPSSSGGNCASPATCIR